jgi:CDP-diacylglycerol--glycerol-3-phosphate 3-phosphatidyltransferase
VRSLLNGPNGLTLLRVGFVPLLGVGIFSQWNDWLLLTIFLVAAITDFLDGWWARKSGLVTSFGKLADPIADKALTGIAWIGLATLGVIPIVAAVLVMVREVGITLLRLVFANRVVQAADAGGKLKTTLQIVTISLLLVTPASFPNWIWLSLDILVWVTVIVTVATGLNYLRTMQASLKND